MEQQPLAKVAVIMAGGQGERFWPLSRRQMPKQFLSLTSDGQTLFQRTVARMLRLTDAAHILVVTNEEYCSIVEAQAPDIPKENILCEPCARNTAPAIGFAAAVARARYGDAMLMVVPSDHLIEGERLYADIMRTALRFAEEKECLVTLGITPSHAETGYGYIHFGEVPENAFPNVYKVNRFVEKPDAATARSYLQSGSYLWNSGMFVWKASVFLEELGRHKADVAALAQAIEDAWGSGSFKVVLAKVFARVQGISVDYAVLEHSDKVFTIPSSFLWNDVGSWYSIGAINQKDENDNARIGNTVVLNSENSVLYSSGRLVAAVGVDNLVVVETADAVLVCDKEHTQDVKGIVKLLKDKNMDQYL